MNLLSGLEKFGLKAEDTTNLFAEEKKEVVGEDGTKPVSYTHLDVYKRQSLDSPH